MAWVAEEKFETYSDEQDIHGTAGEGAGGGWSGNWADVGNNLLADNAWSYDGTFSCRVVSAAGGNTFATHLLASSISSGTGIIYVAMRKSSTSAGTNSFTIRSSVGFRMNIVMDASGNVDSRTTRIITGFTANQAYLFRLTYDYEAATYTVAYSTDPNGSAGTFSAESVSIAMANSGALDRVGMGGDTGANSWVDYISASSPFTGGGGVTVPRQRHTMLMMGVG